MTKDSGVFGVTLPDDCAPKVGSSSAGDGCVSQIATVSELTAYYKDFMGKRGGWTFEPKYSVMDPDIGVSKKLGYTTSQVWCKPTSPITTVIILVGSGSAKDQGMHSEVFVISNLLESSCP